MATGVPISMSTLLLKALKHTISNNSLKGFGYPMLTEGNARRLPKNNRI